MNNIYEVGYSDYEDSPYVMLTHEKKYTQKEFDDIILKCSLEEYKSHRSQFKDIFKDEPEQEYEYDCHFENIYTGLVRRLIDKYKFEKIEASVKFRVFNDSLTNPRYEHYNDGDIDLRPIQQAVDNYEKTLIRLKKIEKFI